jgi:D-amino peptidase
MNIYILADMEGVSGIHSPDQVDRSKPEFEAGCRLLLEEMNVAVDAALAAGATHVRVCDTHGGGGNVQPAMLDVRARSETPLRGRMMPSLDPSFAGVVLLGHHARAGTIGGFLDHTISSRSWFEFRINGQCVGEIGIEAAYAGHFGVPVIAVTGDEATAREARELLGPVPCAVVKSATTRNRAQCLALPDAHARVREAIASGIRAAGTLHPFRPDLPATVQLTLYRTDMAEDLLGTPGTERVDARTLRKTVATLQEIRAW